MMGPKQMKARGFFRLAALPPPALIMSSITANLQAVRQRIESAARAAQRPAQSVRLVAVSKTFAPAAVREAAQAGQRDFGENYVTEGDQERRRARRSGAACKAGRGASAAQAARPDGDPRADAG